MDLLFSHHRRTSSSQIRQQGNLPGLQMTLIKLAAQISVTHHSYSLVAVWTFSKLKIILKNNDLQHQLGAARRATKERVCWKTCPRDTRCSWRASLGRYFHEQHYNHYWHFWQLTPAPVRWWTSWLFNNKFLFFEQGITKARSRRAAPTFKNKLIVVLVQGSTSCSCHSKWEDSKHKNFNKLKVWANIKRWQSLRYEVLMKGQKHCPKNGNFFFVIDVANDP